MVTSVAPGGDPRFDIVVPKGRQVWLSTFPQAKVGSRYAADLQSSGGISPVHWSKVSGQLPPGCTLNANSGVITGTPTAKGKFTFVVQAADSEKKPQNAEMTVPVIFS